ncbi:hypothetical protein [Yunchengibacter salinarum]|uniref:hypothetical protein n=1 Tax=Yunchengibacter salinarum TaxID=3133399 RepID=UPI0035B5B1E2
MTGALAHLPDFGRLLATPLPGDAPAHWLILAGIALLLDALLGSRTLLGRLPGPDRILLRLGQWLVPRLDRERRSRFARAMRGALVVMAFTPILVVIGRGVDLIALDGGLGTLITVLLLARLMEQRALVDLISAMPDRLGRIRPGADGNGRFGASRFALERLAVRFADGLVTVLVLLMLGGMALVLVHRFLTMLVEAGAPKGMTPPASPFYLVPLALQQALALPGAALAALLMALAALLVPGARAGQAWRGLSPFGAGLPARLIPAATLAFALGLNLHSDPDNRPGGRWLGPPDGRARPAPLDMSRALYLILVAGLLILLALVGVLLHLLGGTP